MTIPALKKILTGFGLLTCSLVFTSTVAASDVSLVVSPPRTDLNMNPGDTVQRSVKVTNTSDQELILSAATIDFIVTDDSGTPIKVTTEASGRFLASPWFTLDTNELVIPAKESAQLTAIITAPNDALPGGHYAGIYFEPKERRGENRTVSYTNAQVGSLFAINIAGNINYEAVIKDFSIQNFINEFGPIDFSLTLTNQSDTHITPTSSVVIKDMFSRPLTTLTYDSINIFPFASRTQLTRWDQVWGLGKYTATVTVTYGDTGKTVSRDLPFWIIPYRLLSAILVLLLVIIASYISIKRHFVHRFDQRDHEIDELKRKIAEMENNSR